MSATKVFTVSMVVVIIVVLISIGTSDDEPSRNERPGASSTDTGRRGLSAYRSILGKGGRDVATLGETPSRADLNPDSTVVLLDPGPIDDSDVDALREFAQDGGRLIFGGDTGPSTYTDLTGTDIDHDSAGPREAAPLLPAPETIDISAIDLNGEGSFAGTGSALPVVANGDQSVVAVQSVGKGRIVLLADVTPLANGLIGFADNTQLGLDVAGDAHRPVVFAERVRLSSSTGLAALPSRWALMFGGLTLAGLLLIASRVRRTGPPEEPSRKLDPARRRYVDAVGAALAKVGDPRAAEPVRVAARRRLLLGTAAGVEASDETDLARAGMAAGLEPEEWSALCAPPGDEQQMLAAGSALAKLKEVRR